MDDFVVVATVKTLEVADANKHFDGRVRNFNVSVIWPEAFARPIDPPSASPPLKNSNPMGADGASVAPLHIVVSPGISKATCASADFCRSKVQAEPATYALGLVERII